MKWLVYGHQGWIGSYICNKIKNTKEYSNIELIFPKYRVHNIDEVTDEITSINPDRVVSFIGRTGGANNPTIDYLEDKLSLNIHDNLYGPLLLMHVCNNIGIHFTYMGTGCIFDYHDNNMVPNYEPISIDTEPNFEGSQYSLVKGYTDRMTKWYKNMLNVRIRMPIVEYDCTKNFISKIIRYPKIVSKVNSMTVLSEMWSYLVDDIISGKIGTINMVNSTPIDHETILELYKNIVDKSHKYELVTEDKLDLKSGRSNNILVSSYPNSEPLYDAITKILENWK